MHFELDENNSHIKNGKSLLLLFIAGYLFLLIERPWESISFLRGVPVQLPYALIMIVIAIISNKLIVIKSPTNKWVFGLLALHFFISPFAYKFEYALSQTIEYSKIIIFYVLVLSAVEDEKDLNFIIKAYVVSMLLYVSHSVLEFYNGRHFYRMGITRMIGVDSTYNDPNNFGESIVQSLPFVVVFFKTEAKKIYKLLCLGYLAMSVFCIIQTGSRTSFVALLIFFIILVLKQKGAKLFFFLMITLISVSVVWTNMPEEKKIRIQTLWDKDVGPKNAHSSARGRLVGLQDSWKMFKQKPLTGVGPGGRNYIGYKINNNIHESPTQAHVLVGEIIAELGIFGLILFVGLICSIIGSCLSAINIFKNNLEHGSEFCLLLSEAIIISTILTLFFGVGNHNFYRPMWLWLAAYSGVLYRVSYEKRKELKV